MDYAKLDRAILENVVVYLQSHRNYKFTHFLNMHIVFILCFGLYQKYKKLVMKVQ